MAFGPRKMACALAVLVFGLCLGGARAATGRIDDGLEVMWGDGRGSVSPDGQVMTLSLDRTSGSGWRSKNTYLFARVDLQVKLVANNSAGTVTTCYVSPALDHSTQHSLRSKPFFCWLGRAHGENRVFVTAVHVGRGVGNPRRGRPGVPRQRHRPALHAPHQRLRQRHRRQRAAVPPLVRPHHRLPHLLHRLDRAAHPRAGGRDADQGDEEPRGQGGRLPVVAAHAAVREPVERRRLGHAGRARQDGLVAGAVRRSVPQLHRRGRRVGAGRVRPGDGRDGAAGHEVGARQLHGVRLLPGRQAVPAGLPARVLHAVE